MPRQTFSCYIFGRDENISIPTPHKLYKIATEGSLVETHMRQITYASNRRPEKAMTCERVELLANPAHRVRHVPSSANENDSRAFALTREYSESTEHSRKQQVRPQRSHLALQNGMRHVVDDQRWSVSGGLRKCQHWSYSVELVLDNNKDNKSETWVCYKRSFLLHLKILSTLQRPHIASSITNVNKNGKSRKCQI